ncbi:MAG: nicotinate-nicotinamide nucleotide adenylyltransferase [Pseudomonadota bacterium]
MIIKTKKRNRVALFGGSFNPPHIGHTAICKWLIDRDIADEVWVIPCFIHPFDKRLAPFEHRLEMCKLALSKLRVPLRVLDIEQALGGKSWTLRTIEHLIKQNPGVEFSLITGGDIESEFENWQSFERIKQLIDIIRIPRGKGSPIPNVSSTDIRGRIRMGLPYKNLVETEIAVYIITKALYRDD